MLERSQIRFKRGRRYKAVWSVVIAKPLFILKMHCISETRFKKQKRVNMIEYSVSLPRSS